MKLIRFASADSQSPHFGGVVQDQAVPLLALQRKAREFYPYLNDSRSYLTNLPESQRTARKLFEWCERNLGELVVGERFAVTRSPLAGVVENRGREPGG